MFRFVKRVFVSAIMFFGCNLSSVNTLECVSINNQECKVRPEIVNVNSNESIFYPFSIRTSKCSGISSWRYKVRPKIYKYFNLLLKIIYAQIYLI